MKTKRAYVRADLVTLGQRLLDAIVRRDRAFWRFAAVTSTHPNCAARSVAHSRAARRAVDAETRYLAAVTREPKAPRSRQSEAT